MSVLQSILNFETYKSALGRFNTAVVDTLPYSFVYFHHSSLTSCVLFDFRPPPWNSWLLLLQFSWQSVSRRHILSWICDVSEDLLHMFNFLSLHLSPQAPKPLPCRLMPPPSSPISGLLRMSTWHRQRKVPSKLWTSLMTLHTRNWSKKMF